jgi:Ca2+-binding EF-hand superfamily protein
MKLRSWGWPEIHMNKARKIFEHYDENKGGMLLFDEFCKLATDY